MFRIIRDLYGWKVLFSRFSICFIIKGICLSFPSHVKKKNNKDLGLNKFYSDIMTRVIAHASNRVFEMFETSWKQWL